MGRILSKARSQDLKTLRSLAVDVFVRHSGFLASYGDRSINCSRAAEVSIIMGHRSEDILMTLLESFVWPFAGKPSTQEDLREMKMTCKGDFGRHPRQNALSNARQGAGR